MAIRKVRITETYTYDLVLDVAEDENLDDVIHESENIRFMSEDLFNEITQNDNYFTTLEYEEV